MGCEGCLISTKGQNLQLESIKANAKKYAVENNISVAIYKEGNEYFFIEAQQAIGLNIPVLEFISQYN